MSSPGWYQDPYPGGEGMLRWFDGNVWTGEVQPSAPVTPMGADPAPADPVSTSLQMPTPSPWATTGSSSPDAHSGGNAEVGEVSSPWWSRPIVVVPIAAFVGLVGLLVVAAALSSSSYRHGEVYSMEQLVALCEDGSMLACDRAFWDSPLGSQAELIGGTCGNRLSIGYGPGFDIQIDDPFGPQGSCTALFGERYTFWDRFRH